jgi:hypothetical protein
MDDVLWYQICLHQFVHQFIERSQITYRSTVEEGGQIFDDRFSLCPTETQLYQF